MRTVIQKVKEASVEVDGQIVGSIGKGLLIYLAVEKTDAPQEAAYVGRKISELRIFKDDTGRISLSVSDVGGSVLIVSNFTLYGDCRKGRRPDFDRAATPDLAKQLYERVAEAIAAYGLKVEKGIFAEDMQVRSVNDGPVTFILEKQAE